jgi:hypothetical protein
VKIDSRSVKVSIRGVKLCSRSVKVSSRSVKIYCRSAEIYCSGGKSVVGVCKKTALASGEVKYEVLQLNERGKVYIACVGNLVLTFRFPRRSNPTAKR